MVLSTDGVFPNFQWVCLDTVVRGNWILQRKQKATLFQEKILIKTTVSKH
jgi:hypothetical protein